MSLWRKDRTIPKTTKTTGLLTGWTMKLPLKTNACDIVYVFENGAEGRMLREDEV